MNFSAVNNAKCTAFARRRNMSLSSAEVQKRRAAANAKLTNSDLSHADPSDCDKVFR